jgi:hypothetical protein
VSSDCQEKLALWLCEKIGLIATPDLRCIASIGVNGDILGVVGFDQYNGASIVMHAAGTANWVTRSLLWACFDYPFNICKVNMVMGFIPSGNTDALRFNTHVGFETKNVLEGAHPDGSLVLMTMRRDQCRYILKD